MMDEDNLDSLASGERLPLAATPELQEQNADTRVEIVLAARLGQGDEAPAWLDGMLEEHELDPEAGILVEYDEIVDDEGTFSYGTWLTRSRQFWAFEVRAPRADDAGAVTEVFENITDVTSTAPYMQGVGKSFGALALEVLAEVLPGKP